MFKDKAVREVLLGKSSGGDGFVRLNSRTATLEFPSNGVEKRREYTFMSDDGFLLFLIRKIETLEKKVEDLETKKK